MLTLNVLPVIRDRGIERPYSYLVKAGFTSQAAHKLLSGRSRVFRLDHIELLCRTLLCEPHDLLFFTPGEEDKLSSGNPLFQLRKTQPPSNWKETLAAMPYSELKEITSRIIKS